MKEKSQLGYTLATVYLLTAVVILFRWATGISPVIEGGWFVQEDGHNILESLILLLPLLPAVIMGICVKPLVDVTNIVISDALVFVESIPTLYFLILVIINTISWFYIGKFLQIVFSKVFPALAAKTDRKKARSKV